jgi:hypothetical protein
MTETTHTPGPWRIGDAGNTIFGPKQEDCSAVMIASVLNARGAKKTNARLIASAPELLEACKSLARLAIEKCPRCDGTGKQECGETNEACGQCGGTGEETHNPHPDEIRRARAAIAKATGKQS